jgi:hypothetical protein
MNQIAFSQLLATRTKVEGAGDKLFALISQRCQLREEDVAPAPA